MHDSRRARPARTNAHTADARADRHILPGVASVAALITAIVTLVSVSATENQVQIARQGQATAEQGQFTDRYNAASTNLGSRSIDIRLGGIYAPQRLMQDSPRDQPTIIAVLCAFVRDRTMPTRKPQKPPTIRPPTTSKPP